VSRKIVWHRRDLRIQDNKAVTEAGIDAAPVFIFDPRWLEHKLVSDSRIEFVLESIKDLNRQYSERGSRLSLKIGKPLDILGDLESKGHEVYFNMDANHFRQDMEKAARNSFVGFSSDGVVRDRNDTRSNWAEHAKDWFGSKQLEPAESFNKNPLENTTSLDQIRQDFDVEPTKRKFGEGGTKASGKRLERFLTEIESYSGSISSPSKAEKNTSHLSPYIRYGCIGTRQIYKYARKRAAQLENTKSVRMFADRLFWQLHYTQKIEDNPDLFQEAVNPVYRDLYRDNRDSEKIKAWKEGKTGYPLVDASMRALVQTGWINFRMRAMCASFYSYILKQWWKEGADFYYRHLIDADVAINYAQWQMHSGLVGVHANRIYNPNKQVRDNDPEGEFIRKYVPELRNLSGSQMVKPWKLNKDKQDVLGVKIGKDYPEPIVDYKRQAKKARRFFKAKAPEAYGAFRDDEVWRKASLGDRHDREEILEKASDQKSLDEFR